MTRRSFLSQSAAAFALPAQTAVRPPNIVVILADDQGWADLGCYGSPHIRTPHIDRMAGEGVRFTDFYAQPMCGPSRAALLTGCYPVRNSLMFNHIPRARTGIHPNEVTIAEVLKTRGYATMIAGKWHLGDAPPFRPARHGFDEWFGLPYSNDMWPYHPKITPVEHPRHKEVLERANLTGFDGQGQTYPAGWFPDLPLMSNDEIVELNPDQTKLTALYTQKSIDFIKKNRGKPFFLYVAHSMPHVPLYPGPEFAGKSKRGRYGDAIEELDDSTGRIIETIKELGLDGNTLVIYTSDNGPWAPYGVDAGSAGPLRGAKGSHWEGGVRVPMIARWPGRINPGQVCSEVAGNLDLLPAFAKLSSAMLPAHTIDGRDIFPLMTDAKARSPHDAFYIYEGSIKYRADQGPPVNQVVLKAVRSGGWKLHFDSDLRGTELYDLYGDVGESRNIRDRNPELVRKLEASSRAFDRQLRANVRPLGRLQ